MKTPWLPVPVVSFAIMLLACSTPNARFCETSADCDQADECNQSSQTCVAAARPDADLADEPEATDTCASQCLPSAPLGWAGPMARSAATSGRAPASCDGAYADEFALKSGDISVSNDCECSCSTASGLSCSSAFLTEWTSDETSCEINQCQTVGSTCTANSTSVGTSGCGTALLSNMTDEGVLRARMGNLSGGTCAAPGVTGNASSQFESQTRLCETELSRAGCEEFEVCAPPPSAGFQQQLCIVQEGNTACPVDSFYSERFVVFEGIDDQQSCSASSCSCSAPSGSCGGKIELRGGDGFTCGPVLATLQGATTPFASDDFCAATPAGVTRARYVVDLDNRSCARSGQGSVSGQATGTGASTICCSK